MRSIDEVYELLVAVDKKVDTHIAVATWRMNAMEQRQERQGVRGWQMKLALWGAMVSVGLGLPMAIIGLVN